MAENWRSLGLITVTTAGTPVQVTTSKTPCHAILLQAKPGNVGLTFVGTSNMVKATYVGVNAVIGIPTDTVIPSVHASVPAANNAIDASKVWVDANTSGEGVIVSIIEG